MPGDKKPNSPEKSAPKFDVKSLRQDGVPVGLQNTGNSIFFK